VLASTTKERGCEEARKQHGRLCSDDTHKRHQRERASKDMERKHVAKERVGKLDARGAHEREGKKPGCGNDKHADNASNEQRGIRCRLVECRVNTPSHARASDELGCRTAAAAAVVADVCSVNATRVQQASGGRCRAIRQKVIDFACR
jgi:hypothetical protein